MGRKKKQEENPDEGYEGDTFRPDLVIDEYDCLTREEVLRKRGYKLDEDGKIVS